MYRCLGLIGLLVSRLFNVKDVTVDYSKFFDLFDKDSPPFFLVLLIIEGEVTCVISVFNLSIL